MPSPILLSLVLFVDDIVGDEFALNEYLKYFWPTLLLDCVLESNKNDDDEFDTNDNNLCHFATIRDEALARVNLTKL